jgi:putative glutathione S-transferase
MNMLIDGEWQTDVHETTNEDGEFERSTTSFRDRVRDDPDADHPVEPNRYHLYVSYACPWAHRTLLLRRLTGLEDVISVDVVDPHRRNDGWEFAPDKAGCTPDTVNGSEYLRDIYTTAQAEYTGRVTVPVLWDREAGTIVNNESAEIIRMLDVAFDRLATNDVDLYPPEHRDDVDRLIEAIYEPINNGVYRAGFAGSQEAYENAVQELFDALDRWDESLGDQRFLAGDLLTEADVCMFTTLIRFDHVYHTHFNCNHRLVADYPNLREYVRELYALPGVAETVNLDHITEHYYRSHTDLNPSGIVPVGPDPWFEAEHSRDHLSGGPPVALTDG